MKELLNPNLTLYFEDFETDINLYDSDKKILDCWGKSKEMIEEEPDYYDKVLDLAKQAKTIEQLINDWMFNGHIVKKGERFTNRIELANGESVYLFMHNNVDI